MPNASHLGQDPLALLKHVFGYAAFRGAQAEVIDNLCRGNDVMVIMPTGGGKSLCYQIPALVRQGCGIVVSPLIALMQDQVEALNQLGISAAYLNSTLDGQSISAIERQLLDGQLDLLYVAPERLLQPRTLQLLERVELALFAIDEAHCVSQWGHDFRADYLQLGELQRRFPEVPRIAVTATADSHTRQEIATRLGLERAKHFTASFDRPNIRYRITLKDNPRSQLLRFLREEHPKDAGIVYCLSRKRVEETASWLNSQGFNALPYHAGMPNILREQHQRRFLREDQVIIVATIAFGMGIDKPDVRFVAHLDLPKTIEAYYQETGRAGRDGLPATAWMTYGLQDAITLRHLLQQSQGAESHKREEHRRLNAMLGLCEITSCRRQALLGYFGEALTQPCGNCDNCLSPAATWDGTEAAQMALSTVYRTEQRFGVNHLIDVLRGVNSEKISQYSHHRLSTFGIGAHLDTRRWRSVFRQLIAMGYLNVDMQRHGAITLDQTAREVLRGEIAIALRKDQQYRFTPKSTAVVSANPTDSALWEALRERRRELADAQGIPPYIVFHDSTLRAIFERRPATKTAFGQLPGIGERKRDKYADAFLEVIHSHPKDDKHLIQGEAP